MLKFSVKADGFDELHEAIAQACTKAEHIVALQARYVKLGGNGDVKKFLHQLEAQCGHSSAQ